MRSGEGRGFTNAVNSWLSEPDSSDQLCLLSD